MGKMEEHGEPRKKRKGILRLFWALLPTIFVIMLVGVIVLLTGQIKTESKIIKEKKIAGMRNDRPKTNVVAMEMVPSRLRERINLPGVVKPWVTLKVVAEVRGKITEKKVSEGLSVKKGDVLAVIDSRDYLNIHASAKASYQLAVSNRDRIKALLKENVGTQSQLDDIVAKVRTTKAALDGASLNLERCIIRAPMEGVVNRIYIEKGQYVNTEDPVAEILELNRVKVVVGIPESDVDAVRRLEQFEVTIDALDSKVFQGVRYYLRNTTTNFARLYNLEIALDNSSGEILPDMFARVEIVKTEVPDGLGIPLYALITKNKMNAVYVVDDGIARLKPVAVGIQDGWRVEVRQGLEPGDRVVVVGQRDIDDGEQVAVVRTVRTMEELSL